MSIYDIARTNSIAATFAGAIDPISVTLTYQLIGGMVRITFPPIVGPGSSSPSPNPITMSPLLPPNLRPSSDMYIFARMRNDDNSGDKYFIGMIHIYPDGTLEFRPSVTAQFGGVFVAGTGTKGLPFETTIVY